MLQSDSRRGHALKRAESSTGNIYDRSTGLHSILLPGVFVSGLKVELVVHAGTYNIDCFRTLLLRQAFVCSLVFIIQLKER